MKSGYPAVPTSFIFRCTADILTLYNMYKTVISLNIIGAVQRFKAIRGKIVGIKICADSRLLVRRSQNKYSKND